MCLDRHELRLIGAIPLLQPVASVNQTVGKSGVTTNYFLEGDCMKRFLTFLAALSLTATALSAGPKPQTGTILSHTSAACGTKKSKKQDIDLLCQEYVVRSGSTEYTIRQPKPSDQDIIPLNTAIQFTLDKSKMKFKVNGKSFEFVVISQAAASPAASPSTSPTPNRQ